MSEDRVITIKRTFNHPIKKVWDAWVLPENISKWWGPEGFSTRVESYHFEKGGEWRYVMVSPDGTEYPATGFFQEIIPFEKIVSTDEFDPEYDYDISQEKLPKGTITTTTFTKAGNTTEVEISMMHTSAEEKRKHEELGVIAGFESQFRCLDNLLETEKMLS